MKTFGDLIVTIIDLILTLAIFAGAIWFGLKCVRTLNQATQFKAMDTKDKAVMYVIDNNRYEELQHSYDIVASILGE